MELTKLPERAIGTISSIALCLGSLATGGEVPALNYAPVAGHIPTEVPQPEPGEGFDFPRPKNQTPPKNLR